MSRQAVEPPKHFARPVWGIIPQPGSPRYVGSSCDAEAAKLCSHCGEPIGYCTGYLSWGDTQAHFSCQSAALDHEHQLLTNAGLIERAAKRMRATIEAFQGMPSYVRYRELGMQAGSRNRRQSIMHPKLSGGLWLAGQILDLVMRVARAMGRLLIRVVRVIRGLFRGGGE